MIRSRGRSPTPFKADARLATGRRVRAGLVLAGGLTLREAASEAGLSYPHLLAVAGGREPLLDSDAHDLATVLSCPEGWLRYGWPVDGA